MINKDEDELDEDININPKLGQGELLAFGSLNLLLTLELMPSRIVFVFGTRPEAIKLFPLINKLKENKSFICIIINTGQHKEMIQQILDSLHMDDSIDFNLNLMKKNKSLSI